MRIPTVSVISELPPTTLPEGWHHYHSITELMAAPVADVLLLDLPEARIKHELTGLRNSKAYRFSPIYTRAGHDNADHHPLSDGPIPTDPEQILPAWRLMTERMDMFNKGQAPERFEERVLAWLWSRPSSTLTASRDVRHPQFYKYPLLDSMAAGEQVNDMVWLKLMTEQGWLEPGELLDRIRLCRGCNSGRLNYVDVCPSCNALEIIRQPSLHCFTCGHVAPQEHFLKEGMMICPNCLSRLRHIGSDYDRPLENYRCQSCQAFFVDANVEARCLDCDEHHNPEELKVREIRQFQMTENGRLRCRQGFAENAEASYFGRLNLIPPKAFQTLLDWQIQQGRRYRDTPDGSLLLVRFVNLNEALNSARGMTLLDSLIDRLQEAVRETDRCTRTREDLVWLLLPHTDRDGMNVLWRRLSELTQQFRENDELRIEVRLAGYTLPEQLLAQEDAQLLMARLMGEVT